MIVLHNFHYISADFQANLGWKSNENLLMQKLCKTLFNYERTLVRTYLLSRWQKFSLTAKLSNLKERNGRNYTHLEKVEWWSKEPLINLRQHLYFENFETHN